MEFHVATDGDAGVGNGDGRDGPRSGSGFVGRADELAQLRLLLHDPTARLITLTGPGGVGKTRLAREIAASDQEGECAFVPLAVLTDPSTVLPAIARAVGIVEAEERLPELLRDWLPGRRMLLVLDNL